MPSYGDLTLASARRKVGGHRTLTADAGGRGGGGRFQVRARRRRKRQTRYFITQKPREAAGEYPDNRSPPTGSLSEWRDESTSNPDEMVLVTSSSQPLLIHFMLNHGIRCQRCANSHKRTLNRLKAL